jgi:DNA topoisomerase-2
MAQVEKTIEQLYQKKSPKEHVKLRPDTYIGSKEPTSEMMWVADSLDKIEKRNIVYVPGLYKIYDEILVNAADRTVVHLDKSTNIKNKCNQIYININQEDNEISVCNNGDGVPIVINKDHKIYVPELIFANMLTSTNFDDSAKRVTGGRNGYGAKLTNIFSKEFTVETVDHNKKKNIFKRTKIIWILLKNHKLLLIGKNHIQKLLLNQI